MHGLYGVLRLLAFRANSAEHENASADIAPASTTTVNKIIHKQIRKYKTWKYANPKRHKYFDDIDNSAVSTGPPSSTKYSVGDDGDHNDDNDDGDDHDENYCNIGVMRCLVIG